MKRLFINFAAIVVVLFTFTGCSESPKTIDLLSGDDLSNWTMFVNPKTGVDPSSIFSISNGVLKCDGVPNGYIRTNQKYSNFKLNVEWRWADGVGTNSGIFLFAQEEDKVWPHAIECQLCRGSAGDFVLLGGSDLAEFKLQEGQERPAFPVVTRRIADNENVVGEWNSAEIICQDGSITVYINGKLQNEGSGLMYSTGYIALQSEGGPIEFKNVKLQELL